MAIQYVSLPKATEEQRANAPYKVSGVRPSPDPHKHWIYGNVVPMGDAPLPPKSNNGRPGKILDQKDKGACTGFGGSDHSSYEFRSIDGQWVEYSEDFLYNLARTLDGLPDTDEGSTPLAIMQVKQKFGVCLASSYPYRADIKTVRTDIPKSAYDEALKRRIDAYAKAPTLDEMKHALASGKTLLSGLIVTESFMRPEAGGFCGDPLGTIYGGHCVNLFDYDDTLTHTYADGTTKTGFFLFANSWTEAWGDGGVGYLPYDFITWADKDLGMHFFMEAWTSVPSGSNPPVNPQPKPTPQPPTPPTPPAPTQVPAVELWVNMSVIKINGKAQALDASEVPFMKDNRVFTSARCVAEALGHKVDWDNPNNHVIIW